MSVVIAAARPATRSALLALVEREPALLSLGTASDLGHTVRILRASAPDVVVLDTSVLGPVDRLRALASAPGGAAFIVIGMSDHPGFAERVRAAGGAGYVRLDQASERLAVAAVAAASPDAS